MSKDVKEELAGASPQQKFLRTFLVKEEGASQSPEDIRARERQRNLLRLFGYFSSETVQENGLHDALKPLNSSLAYSCALIKAAEALIQTCQQLPRVRRFSPQSARTVPVNGTGLCMKTESN